MFGEVSGHYRGFPSRLRMKNISQPTQRLSTGAPDNGGPLFWGGSRRTLASHCRGAAAHPGNSGGGSSMCAERPLASTRVHPGPGWSIRQGCRNRPRARPSPTLGLLRAPPRRHTAASPRKTPLTYGSLSGRSHRFQNGHRFDGY